MSDLGNCTYSDLERKWCKLFHVILNCFQVNVEINDEPVHLNMRIGEAGEAFFQTGGEEVT